MKLDIKWEDNTKSSAIYNIKDNIENLMDRCAPEKKDKIRETLKYFFLK